MPHVAQYETPNTNTPIITTHFAAPEWLIVLVAYMHPMRNMHVANAIPPVIAEALLPHLSANKKAGTDTTSIKMPEIPDAKNEAVSEDRPA